MSTPSTRPEPDSWACETTLVIRHEAHDTDWLVKVLTEAGLWSEQELGNLHVARFETKDYPDA